MVNWFSTFSSSVSCFQWSHLIHIAFSIKPFGIQRSEMFSIVFRVFSSGFCFFLRPQLFTATSNGRNSFYNQTHWCSAGLIVFSGVSAVLSGVNCFQWFPMIHIALSIKHRDSADTAIFNCFSAAISGVSGFLWFPMMHLAFSLKPIGIQRTQLVSASFSAVLPVSCNFRWFI